MSKISIDKKMYIDLDEYLKKCVSYEEVMCEDKTIYSKDFMNHPLALSMAAMEFQNKLMAGYCLNVHEAKDAFKDTLLSLDINDLDKCVKYIMYFSVQIADVKRSSSFHIAYNADKDYFYIKEYPVGGTDKLYFCPRDILLNIIEKEILGK